MLSSYTESHPTLHTSIGAATARRILQTTSHYAATLGKVQVASMSRAPDLTYRSASFWTFLHIGVR
jgi:hypothetical protein